MSAEEVIKFNVVYDVRGIDSSIRQSQRLLYFMNAVRLSVTDLQQVMSGPTIANIMWSAVQLTRVWTTAYRWVRMTNEAQRMGIAQGVAGGIGRGAASAAARRFAVGQTSLMFGEGGALGIAGAQAGFLASLIPILSNPFIAAALIGGTIVVTAAAWDRNERIKYNEWAKRQREIAKSQGIEY